MCGFQEAVSNTKPVLLTTYITVTFSMLVANMTAKTHLTSFLNVSIFWRYRDSSVPDKTFKNLKQRFYHHSLWRHPLKWAPAGAGGAHFSGYFNMQ